MLLQEWIEKTGVKPTHHANANIVSLIATQQMITYEDYNALHELDDYTVDSVAAPVIWLVPKPLTKEHQ